MFINNEIVKAIGNVWNKLIKGYNFIFLICARRGYDGHKVEGPLPLHKVDCQGGEAC